MPVFDLHPDIKAALAKHIEHAIDRVNPQRYRQEPHYINALISKLDAKVYEGPHGYLELRGTSVDDHGPGAAERESGADFAITAIVGFGTSQLKKAVLGQAKRGRIEQLTRAESGRLTDQIEKLKLRTKHYVIVETPFAAGQTVAVRRSVPTNPARQHASQTLEDYLEQLIRCSHGDRRRAFVDAVQDSSLPELKVTYRRN